MKKTLILFTALLLVRSIAFAQWTNLNVPNSTDAESLNYSKMAVSPDGKNIAVFTQDLSFVTFKTTFHYTVSHDYGNSWQVYSAPDTAGLAAAQIYNTSPLQMFWEGDDLYIQDLNPQTALKRSSDFGASFTTIFNSTEVITNIMRCPNGNWYYTYASDEVYKSTDKGLTWNPSTTGAINFLEYLVTDNGNLIASTFSGIYYSTDGGDTWQRSTFSDNDHWTDAANSLSKASDGTLLYMCATSTRLYKSTDNGVNWQRVTAALPINPIKMYYSGTDLITLSTAGDTFKSTDGGATFTQLTPRQPQPGNLMYNGNAMAYSTDDIFIDGQAAVYRYNKSANAVSSAVKPDITTNVYPNPATNLIHIKSQFPVKTLVITNTKGETILHTNHPGTSVDVSNVPNGIYFVHCQYDDHSEIQKLVISR
jgi:photosystem II stability/assembly factor-like uncharacterized protein